jgi:serine/threonine protein kinase
MEAIEFGRYQLLELIGEGGMGRVFRGRDTAIGRDVAIKVLPSELATEEGYRERFRREAHAAAQLTEPHIVPIFDTGEIDDRLYLVMPIIGGTDLATVLRRDRPMSPRLAVRVIEHVGSALDAAHARGLRGSSIPRVPPTTRPTSPPPDYGTR